MMASSGESTSARRLPPRTLRTHLSDASIHLRFAARALEGAAQETTAEIDARALEALAKAVVRLAGRVDPATAETRYRRAHR